MKCKKRQKEGKGKNKKVKEKMLGMKSFIKPGKLERLDFSFVLNFFFFLREKRIKLRMFM